MSGRKEESDEISNDTFERYDSVPKCGDTL